MSAPPIPITEKILSFLALASVLGGLHRINFGNLEDLFIPQLFIGSGLLIFTVVFFWFGYITKVYSILAFGLISHYNALQLLFAVDSIGSEALLGFWLLSIASWATAWVFIEEFSRYQFPNSLVQRLVNTLIPVIFGLWILIIWQLLVRGFDIPRVLLPAPSEIAERFYNSLPIIWADFQQTFLKAVLIGYLLGCGSGLFVALLVDRSPFLKRGLLPFGNFVSALPIIGIAPIMVMWFGFDWPSKAAVVVVMTFFPMLVNATTGLAASNKIELDLMHTYHANYWQSLIKLRLPQAMPFIFNALKINSTLALIGAIVAEFFGTPIVGMGFRISTEVGRMNIDMVWAEITVAAVAGSIFYGLIVLVERSMTYWHPSMRG